MGISQPTENRLIFEMISAAHSATVYGLAATQLAALPKPGLLTIYSAK